MYHSLDQYNPESKLDKSDVKTLKSLEKVDIEDIDLQIRHSYPPVWQWPKDEKTKVVYIQPWEFPRFLLSGNTNLKLLLML